MADSAEFDASEFVAGLRRGGEVVISAAAKATDVFAEQVIGDAQQITPVDKGTLQASGTTGEPTTFDWQNIQKTVAFNTNYAAAVHEILTAHHEVGQAKFLEVTLRQSAPKYGPFVAGKVKDALGE